MTSSWKCCCYVAILMTIPAGVITYNFDADNVIVYEDAARSGGFPGSYAGYSVALWNPGDRGINDSWIFIGAPRANTTAYPGTKESGTVFKCKIREKCQEWVMKSTNDEGPGDGSWLGGTMEIENTTDPDIVVCGPRWLDKMSGNVIDKVAWAMKGTCYRAKAKSLAKTSRTKGASVILPYSPLYNRIPYMMAAFGSSIHIVPDDLDRSIIFGAPGFGYGQGSPIEYKSNTKLHFSTPRIAQTEKYEYGGYAVTSGFYFGRQWGRLYASSSPRSANLYGKVVLFKFTVANSFISIRDTHNGKQVGEYFGSALASCDIYGDGIDSLIVGAPHWSKIVDEGRIYVFRKQSSHSLTETQPSFKGEKPRGRFGSTITCLGDIDYDGYADVAVGAPYEDNGVVYIYHGSKDGLRRTQKISGSQGTKGFGISISQPRDIDNNDYADIVVGAYLSGHVTLFRSKRAVTTQVTLSTDVLGNDLPRNATSLSIKVCSSYSGRHAPPELNVTKELKIDELYQRAELKINEQKRRIYKYPATLRLKDPNQCETFTIHIREGKRNFLKPLKFSVIQSLDESYNHGTLLVRKDGTISGEDFFNSDSTITNMLHPLVESSTEVRFAVKCGADNLCNSRLVIQTGSNLGRSNRYVIGSAPNMTLGITIQNHGDPAYSAEVVVTVPRFIRLIVSQVSQYCNSTSVGESMQVTCSVGDPLDRNETEDISLDFDLSEVKLDTTEILMDVKAITASKNAVSGNSASLRINCTAETDIGIIRKSTMDRYSYNLDEKKKELPSIAFQHIYEIKNYEVTKVAEALLSVSIPTHWIDAGNEIEIIRLNKTTAYLEGQEFHCEDAETDMVYNSTSYDATTSTEWLISDGNSTRFEAIDGKIFAASPDNRTLHINCTNPSIKWKTINCKINNFENTQSVARLALKFDLLLSNFTPGIIQEKDIIFFVTNGSVRILGVRGETINKKPNLVMIGTIFTGYPGENPLPGWVIPVSILVGLLLLILLALGLYKFGFFKRNKQVELRALLKENDETTAPAAAESSRGSSYGFT